VVATAVMAPTKCLARRFVRNFFIKSRFGRVIDDQARSTTREKRPVATTRANLGRRAKKKSDLLTGR